MSIVCIIQHNLHHLSIPL